MNKRQPTFLLVEDDDDHAELMLSAMESEDSIARVDRASDGEQALRYLRNREPGHSQRPDLVLLDLNLPRINGLDVLAAMKGDPDLAAIPVVILTTSEAAKDRRAAYELHASSYLVKPTGCSSFQQLLRDLCAYWGRWNQPGC